MKRFAWPACALGAAAIILSACERQAEDAALPPGGQAVASASRHADAPAGIAWFDGGVEAAFERAHAEQKPVFLYWGAVWCPYCKDLKAHVFSRRDFKEKLELFVPVYLDGDDPGAQRWGETFGIAGYPTVLALGPDRAELARIAGGMDVSTYAGVLDLVLGDVRPLDDLLASIDASAGPLPRDDCRRLAYNGWGLDDSATSDADRIAAVLAAAAMRCPGDARVERARLTALAAAYASDAEADAVRSGAPAGARLAALVDGVQRMLADRELAVSAADALQYLGTDFFDVAKRLAPPRAAQLGEQWTAVMDAVANDASYTEGDRIAAIGSKVTAVKALAPGGEIPAALAAEANGRIDEALARVDDPWARAGLVNAAINLLYALDDPERAYEIAEREMKISKTPYYYMADLAVLDEKMDRKAEAIEWLERAYSESHGAATRFEWGTDYVLGLIRMSPDDDATIGATAVLVLGELDGPDRIYGGRTHVRLARLDTALREWNADGAHEQAFDAIRARAGELCAAVPQSEPEALESCRAFLSPSRG